jgi:hypothetical protein
MKNIIELNREVRDFKKGYQPRTNIVKDEQGDFVTDYHSILTRWRKNFSQLFNVHGVSKVRQAEILTAALPVLETSAFEVEMTIEKISHESPCNDQIPAKLINTLRTGDADLRSYITTVQDR